MSKVTGQKKTSVLAQEVKAAEPQVTTAIPLEQALGVAINEFAVTGKAALRTACSVCLAYLIGIPFAGTHAQTEQTITKTIQDKLEASMVEAAKAKAKATNPNFDPAKDKVIAPKSTMQLYVTLGHQLYTYLTKNSLLGNSPLAHDIAESKDATVALATLVTWFSHQTIAIGENMVLRHVNTIDDMRMFLSLKSARQPAAPKTPQQRVETSVKSATEAVKKGDVKPEAMAHTVVDGVAKSDMGIKGVETIAREAFAKIAALASGDNVQVADKALEMLEALKAELDKAIDAVLAKSTRGQKGKVTPKTAAEAIAAHKH